jgi:hypothetical protein
MPLNNNTGVSQKVFQFFIHIYTHVIHTKICVFTKQLVLKIMTVGISDLKLYFTCDMQMCTVAYFLALPNLRRRRRTSLALLPRPPGAPPHPRIPHPKGVLPLPGMTSLRGQPWPCDSSGSRSTWMGKRIYCTCKTTVHVQYTSKFKFQ